MQIVELKNIEELNEYAKYTQRLLIFGGGRVSSVLLTCLSELDHKFSETVILVSDDRYNPKNSHVIPLKESNLNETDSVVIATFKNVQEEIIESLEKYNLSRIITISNNLYVEMKILLLKRFKNYLERLEDEQEELANKIKILEEIKLYNEKNRSNIYVNAVVSSLIDECKRNLPSQYIVQNLVKEIKKEYKIPIYDSKCIVVVGKGWSAKALSKLLKEKDFRFVNADDSNWEAEDREKCVFLVCEEKAEFNACLCGLDENQIIRIDYLLNADFVKTPDLKKVFYVFDKSYRKIEAKGLVNGLSYARDAIHMDLLEVPMLTLANSGQDLYYNFLCLKYAYERCDSLKYVITTIAPYSLRYDESLSKLKKGDELFYYTVFSNVHHAESREVQLYKREREKIDDILGKDVWENFSNTLYEDFGLERYNKYISEKDVFNPLCVESEEEEMLEKLFSKPYEETVREYKQILKDYCEYAEGHNLKMLFLITPYSEFYKERWEISYINEVRCYLQMLGKTYSFDYIDLSDKVWSDYRFRDSGHLNRVGAIYVCEIINKWLKGSD